MKTRSFPEFALVLLALAGVSPAWTGFANRKLVTLDGSRIVKLEGRGAVAALSPSRLSLDGPAHEYHRALMAELASGRHARLGDAALATQRDYAETGLMPELLSVYPLLEDPPILLR